MDYLTPIDHQESLLCTYGKDIHAMLDKLVAHLCGGAVRYKTSPDLHCCLCPVTQDYADLWVFYADGLPPAMAVYVDPLTYGMKRVYYYANLIDADAYRMDRIYRPIPHTLYIVSRGYCMTLQEWAR